MQNSEFEFTFFVKQSFPRIDWPKKTLSRDERYRNDCFSSSS